jgi:hypothetical protein
LSAAAELAAFFLALYPEFDPQWRESCQRDGNSFTAHGVCLEFGWFYTNSGAALDARRAWDLFQKVEQLVAADQNDNNAVANALCTCFLEGIASTAAGEASQPFMGGKTLEYFRRWHVEP